MKVIVLIALALAMLVSSSSGQFYSPLFSGFDNHLRLSSGLRDAKANTGPVLFPPGPPPNNADTSGVIVGASGFGFVPPGASHPVAGR